MSDTIEAPKIALSPEAAYVYEADLFAEKNPGYFKCNDNFEALSDYLNLHKMQFTAGNIETAYRELTKKNKLVVQPTSDELARMSSDEVMAFSKKYGREEFDTMGRSIGYVFNNQNMARSTADDEAFARRHRRRGASSQRDALPGHRMFPQDAGRIPTRREWAMWGPDRMREWVENETEDGRLPLELR